MELVSRCVECGLAEPESLASLGGSAPGVVDGILSTWANSTKAERRDALQAALDEHVNSGLGASRVAPLATKELYELLFQARLASHIHEAEDLTKGVSPFTCGYQVGERDQDVAVRAHRFDQMLLGHTDPTLAEQETLRTRDLPDLSILGVSVR